MNLKSKMNSVIKTLFCVFAFSLLTTNCDQATDMGVLTIPDHLENQTVYSNDVTAQEIRFLASDPWEITFREDMTEEDQSWIFIAPMSGNSGIGNVAVAMSPNKTGKDRTVFFTLTCGKDIIPLSVTQKAEAR